MASCCILSGALEAARYQGTVGAVQVEAPSEESLRVALKAVKAHLATWQVYWGPQSFQGTLLVRLVEGDVPLRPFVSNKLSKANLRLSIAWTENLGRFEFLRRLSAGFLEFANFQHQRPPPPPWLLEAFARRVELNLYPALVEVYCDLLNKERFPAFEDLLDGQVESFGESLTSVFLLDSLEEAVPIGERRAFFRRLFLEKDSWVVLKEAFPQHFSSKSQGEIWWLLSLVSEINSPQNQLETATFSGKRLDFLKSLWTRRGPAYQRWEVGSWDKLLETEGARGVLLSRLSQIHLYLLRVNPVYHNTYLSLGKWAHALLLPDGQVSKEALLKQFEQDLREARALEKALEKALKGE